MVLSELVFQKYYITYGVLSDPLRLAAQVVSGVGFLGAGTIIHYGNSVKGLTTAASIWAVAALGLVCGSGFFFLAFFGLFTIELVLISFDRYSKRSIFKPKTLDLFLTIVQTPEIIGNIMLLLSVSDISVIHMDLTEINRVGFENKDVEIVRLKLVLNTRNSTINNSEIFQRLEKLDGIMELKY